MTTNGQQNQTSIQVEYLSRSSCDDDTVSKDVKSLLIVCVLVCFVGECGDCSNEVGDQPHELDSMVLAIQLGPMYQGGTSCLKCLCVSSRSYGRVVL